MASLFLPATSAQKLSPGYRLPDALKQYQIPGAEGGQLVVGAVIAFVQALTVNGFTLGYVVLQVRQPTTLPFTSIKESAILHYLLRGGLHIGQFKDTSAIQHSSRQYGLGYHPNGSKLALHFEEGEYQYFQLAFSGNLLQHLLHSFPLPLLNPLPPYPVFTNFLHITKKVNNLIQLLLLQTYRAVPDVLQLNNYALQLTARFLNDYRIQERQQHWERKKKFNSPNWRYTLLII